MPQGLQVFNADGSILLDTSTRTARIIGSVTVTGAQYPDTTASVVVAEFAIPAGQQPFLLAYSGSRKPGQFYIDTYSKPGFAVIQFSWVYDYPNPIASDTCTAFYGVS